jgi:hypothetical protein
VTPVFTVSNLFQHPIFVLISTIRDRLDTIRCIVSNLVGDDDSGDSLVDESEPIQPLQQQETEDYSDPHWEPEPMDAGPGKLLPAFLVLSTL